jgi:TonB family protein
MHISGNVRLEAVVAPNGSVKAVEVRGGHPVLALSAQAAVRDWKYEAGPRETRETVEVKFTPQ